jgi:hypothetical protein
LLRGCLLPRSVSCSAHPGAPCRLRVLCVHDRLLLLHNVVTGWRRLLVCHLPVLQGRLLALHPLPRSLQEDMRACFKGTKS